MIEFKFMKFAARKGDGLRTVRVLALSGLSAILLFIVLSGCDGPTEEPRTGASAARVGGSTITVEEFRAELARILPEGGEEISEEELRELKKGLLNRMIEERLILVEAERMGISVTEEEVSQEMKALWDGPMDEESRASILKGYSSLDDWKSELRKKLIIRKTVQTVVNAGVEVTDEEAREYYDKNRKEYEMPEQVRARMIVVETEEEARRAMERLRSERFEAVAEEVSVGPEAVDGGDLGFFGRGDMPVEFEEVVFKLPAGSVSGIVRTPYGYHIFKVIEKKKVRRLGFDDVKQSIMEKLRTEKTEDAYRRWLLSLQKKSRIEVDREIL